MEETYTMPSCYFNNKNICGLYGEECGNEPQVECAMYIPQKICDCGGKMGCVVKTGDTKSKIRYVCACCGNKSGIYD